MEEDSASVGLKAVPVFRTRLNRSFDVKARVIRMKKIKLN